MGGTTAVLTFTQRLEYLAARALAALPSGLQVRLSGKPAVELDGDTLAPDIQLLLAVMERRREPGPETLGVAGARAMRRRQAASYGGKLVPVGAVRGFQIEPGLDARHYAPSDPGGPHPLLVFFHGGGFTYGDLDTHDNACRMLCRYGGMHVLAVDYRLAPEHPFPAAVEDAYAAFRFAAAHAAELGADPSRVAVGGDSAGGNLAAVVSQLAAREAGPAPALQLLIYPVTDLTTRRRSHELFGEGFLLTDAEMSWFEGNYIGAAREHASDPRVSPLLARDLAGLAPALVVTAAFDPLRDEGEAYAEALRAAGTPVVLRRFPGFIHAFVSMAGVSPACRDALIAIASSARGMLAAVGARTGDDADWHTGADDGVTAAGVAGATARPPGTLRSA